jgi:hypothetical protein
VTAKETEELFNHDFVKKFRDHVAEKSRLGTLSTLNVERVFKEFYFEAEKRCSVSDQNLNFIIFY